MTTLAWILAVLPVFQPQAPATPAATTLPLYDARALQLAMARLETEHPELCARLVLGESRQKRKIELLRIAAGPLQPGRPALLVVANIDGPLAWTSSIAIDHAQRLVAGYANDARVKRLLDTTTIYLVPRANPDAAEARFLAPLRETAASGSGVDNDRDGRSGEDGASDLNEDGFVTWMRVPDPDGEWTGDPIDPRALVQADRSKGQRGQWKLFPEANDSDHDERAGEDPELDTVLNRNFPQGWQEHADDAGRYATDEPEARALCDFVLLHKDIAAVLTYGMLDNLVEKPKSEQKEPRRSASPSEGVPEADAKLLAEFGKRYRELTQNKSKSEGKDAGTFQAWVQAQRGLWTFNVNAWSLPLDEQSKKDKDKEAPDAKPAEQAAKGDKPDAADKSEKPDKKKDKDKDAPEPSDDAKRLRWIDAKVEGARFVDWKPFQHPELGAVEIGGFKPYALIEPPESERAPIAAAHYDFFLFAAESLPRVRVVECKAKDLAGGLWQIDAVLQNDALLPFMSALGRRSQSVRGVRAELQLPAGAQILAGNVQSLIPDLGGSGGRKELRWLVRGAPPSSIELIVDSDHAGTVKQSPEVK